MVVPFKVEPRKGQGYKELSFCAGDWRSHFYISILQSEEAGSFIYLAARLTAEVCDRVKKMKSVKCKV